MTRIKRFGLALAAATALGPLAAIGTASAQPVAVNVGGASNHSNGTAIVATGPATAVGNASSTNITQVAVGGNRAINLSSQRARVTNRGRARANSGGNVAIGNNSTNIARNFQFALAF
jgi:hypothetical protein